MDISLILTVVLAVAALFCFIKLLSAPIRFIFKFIFNMVSGFLILLVCEIVLGFFNISIGINLINCLIAGICGIPGVVVLLLVQILL